jgi:hypothetical protein
MGTLRGFDDRIMKAFGGICAIIGDSGRGKDAVKREVRSQADLQALISCSIWMHPEKITE